jgi:hypothetical protein
MPQLQDNPLQDFPITRHSNTRHTIGFRHPITRHPTTRHPITRHPHYKTPPLQDTPLQDTPLQDVPLQDTPITRHLIGFRHPLRPSSPSRVRRTTFVPVDLDRPLPRQEDRTPRKGRPGAGQGGHDRGLRHGL